MADKQRIEQVFIDLLSNAIKYSPGEDKVIAKSRKTNREIIIKIRDFEIGIPKQEQENILSGFVERRIRPYISMVWTGIIFSKDVINRHGGRRWVKPEEKGSAFYFSLPLKTHQEQQKQALKSLRFVFCWLNDFI